MYNSHDADGVGELEVPEVMEMLLDYGIDVQGENDVKQKMRRVGLCCVRWCRDAWHLRSLDGRPEIFGATADPKCNQVDEDDSFTMSYWEFANLVALEAEIIVEPLGRYRRRGSKSRSSLVPMDSTRGGRRSIGPTLAVKKKKRGKINLHVGATRTVSGQLQPFPCLSPTCAPPAWCSFWTPQPPPLCLTSLDLGLPSRQV